MNTYARFRRGDEVAVHPIVLADLGYDSDIKTGVVQHPADDDLYYVEWTNGVDAGSRSMIAEDLLIPLEHLYAIFDDATNDERDPLGINAELQRFWGVYGGSAVNE